MWKWMKIIAVSWHLSRPGLEIELTSVYSRTLQPRVLAEDGCNQGPTKLDGCKIHNVVLANGLCGNSRLRAGPFLSGDQLEVGRTSLAIATPKENKGLVNLVLEAASDETWDAVCVSLSRHISSLESLSV
jgi:hypothetical protein